MARYIITYDLSEPGRNYDELYKRIKSYGNWAEITESSWAIETDQKSTEIRDYLNQALDNNDKIIVGNIGRFCLEWTEQTSVRLAKRERIGRR